MVLVGLHTQRVFEQSENEKLTSPFDPKETQAVYQVPFSFSHQSPFDACKAPGSPNWEGEFKILKNQEQTICFNA